MLLGNLRSGNLREGTFVMMAGLVIVLDRLFVFTRKARNVTQYFQKARFDLVYLGMDFGEVDLYRQYRVARLLDGSDGLSWLWETTA